MAAGSLARQLAMNDPAAAIKWVDTIQDDKIWQNTAQQIAWQWLRINAPAAKAWVAQSALPEDFKKNFANHRP
jgi:hypothetical protein